MLEHFEPGLDGVDGVECVLPRRHDHDATVDLALAIELGDTAPHLGPQAHRDDVAQQHRCAGFVRIQDDVAEVLQGSSGSSASGPCTSAALRSAGPPPMTTSRTFCFMLEVQSD